MPQAVGRHMPLDARPREAFATARSIGCDTIQIFVGNPRGWTPATENPTEVAAFREQLTATGFTPIVIHAAYLINLASNTEETRTRSVRLLRWTLERGAAIGAHEVVMHIGSHGGGGLAVGMERLISGLREVGRDLPLGPRLLLENDVGAGNTIGSRFESMAEVLTALRDDWGDRLGVCLDTAHLWGAGFDIGTPESAQTTLDQIDTTCGLARVGVIHLNDTTTKLGGHRDLHARLGEGIIGKSGLQTFLGDKRLANAAILLETPIRELPEKAGHDWDHDRAQIALARALLVGTPAE